MPRPFLELTLDQFAELVARFPWKRTITEVHLHHTFKPDHADFRSRPPVQSIEGMFRFHTETRGFSDIAQHLTIDPRGVIWTGRNFNDPPASAVGFNGNATNGPFMIEMIGNFDQGHDTWEGAQLETAIAVTALLQRTHGLKPDACRFHNEMSTKTCPGSTIRRDEVVKALEAAHTRAPGARAARTGAFPDSASRERANTDRLLQLFSVDVRGRGVTAADTEPPEQSMTVRERAMSAGEPGAFMASRDTDRELTAEDKERLRRHIVNLRMGALSSGGLFQTTREDVEALFDEHLPAFLEERRQEDHGSEKPLRLVFFAHGGLNEEDESLKNARNRLDFYLQNRCYPVFFVWETGVKETLVDILREIVGLGPARGIVDTITDFTDPGLETAFRNGGFAMWANMKRSADLAFLPKQGGAVVVERLVQFWKDHSADVSIHAIGHSAGCIFHALFLQSLCEQPSNPPVEIESVHYLAPAITVELFKNTLMPLVGGRVKNFTEYTMRRELEKGDAVGPYRKSLLYLVSRSFEDLPETPILGLEESIRRDPDLMRLFGLLAISKTRKGEVLFSDSTDGPRRSTIAKKHGDFDNDRLTMGSVIRRITGTDDASPIAEFPEQVSRTILDARPAGIPARPIAVSAAVATAAAPSGRRRALCVGIDAYDAPNRLAGCVNDANDWSAALRGQGFEVSMLTDGGASWQTICDALDSLVTRSSAGDMLVFQYAGHGTLVDDLDGDEQGGRDSALCPVDFPRGGFIIDDDLRRIFGKLPDGVGLTCFFDCCHSGTITRLVAPARDLPVGGDVRVRGLQATPEMEAAHRNFRQSLSLTAPARRGPEVMREISFTACTDAQTAQEVNGHGQFTLRALATLRQGIAGVTNADFHARVVTAFGSGAAAQTPQLDCAPLSRTLPLFAIPGGAATAVPAVGGDVGAILARLADIDRRLARLGA